MRWVAFIFVAAHLAGGLASAAPIVEIRARTQLGLSHVKLVEDGKVQVYGHLRDKLTGAGIPYEPVTVSLGGQRVQVVTGEDGAFAVALPAAPGPVAVSLEYAGAARLEKADPLTVTTDPAKAQVELSIVKTTDDPAGARLRITAEGDGGPITLPVTLDIAPVGGDAFEQLRTVQTGGEIVFTRLEAGGAGAYRLRAQFPGSPTHQAAMAIVTIELTSGSSTTMNLSAAQLAFEDDLVVTGRVTDDDGAPLPRVAVTLMSGDRRLAQGTTGEGGTYRFEIEAEVIGQGQFGLQVQADPGATFIQGSRSAPAIVRIKPPQPVPVSYTIAAFLATVVAAGGFFAARNKPWRKLGRPRRPAEVPSEEPETAHVQGGLVTAKPGVVATLRRPSDDGFSGVVRDAVRGRPVADATVALVFGDLEHSLRTAPDGSFAIESLPPGDWRAEVAAAGHVTERFTVTIPHRGELRGVRVDLVPVRERVFQLYRRAAEPMLPEPRLWGIWSPRQIVDHVRAKRPSPALAELTDFVEEIYFSGRVSDEAVLPQAESRVTRAVHERAARPR